MSSPYRVVMLDRTDGGQRAMLAALTDIVFGFTHDAWYRAGCWDDRYRVYSVTAGDHIAASAAVAMMDLLISGRPIAAIQIGAVATHPDHRGQGLAKQVMDSVLAQYPGVPAFLFAHQGVVDFYPKFGFRCVAEAQPHLALEHPVSGAGTCMRLKPEDPRVVGLLGRRNCFSDILDTRNATSINIFHAIMGFERDIYFVPDLDTLVVARQQGSRLTIYDVASSAKQSLEAIIGALPFAGVDTIEFAFTPDWLCGEYSIRPYDSVTEDHYLFVRGLDWPRGAKFPHTAST